uniref:Putative conserved secreted protein n=1 Tax=Lutzomyia longipalpis TaxID=7200 RepID=A0A1B0GIP2_LUTLO
MPICLCLFIGIPASGKTTTARRIVSLAEEKESTGIVVNHLNYDDFVQPETCYRDFRKEMLDRIEDYVQKHTTLEKSMVLIVDDCMILRSMRKEVHSIARKHRLGYFQVWFRIPLEKSIERNRMRVNAVPEDTVEKLFSTLEDPVKDSNVDTLVI